MLKFKDSSRGETCKKLGIPVVSERYIDESTSLGIKQVYYSEVFHLGFFISASSNLTSDLDAFSYLTF